MDHNYHMITYGITNNDTYNMDHKPERPYIIRVKRDMDHKNICKK